MSKVITAVDLIKVAGNAALKAKREYLAIGADIRVLKAEIIDAQRDKNYKLVSRLHSALKYRRLELEAANDYYGDCRAAYSNLCNAKYELEQKALTK